MLRLMMFGILSFYFLGQSYADSPAEIANSIGMKLKLVPSGTFMMGSATKQAGSGDDERQVKVTLSKPFYLGVYEVTQDEYTKVMGENSSFFQKEVIGNIDSRRLPVEQVSWEEAVEFCKRLSEMEAEKKSQRVYRLPTEAEWEYACRAGTETAFHFGEREDRLSEFAWFASNAQRMTHAVGAKKPNAWGFFDMTGNAWEWCQDRYGEYPVGSVTDPTGTKESEFRVLRGGSWYHDATFCRSSSRYRAVASDRHNFGFRVALTVKEATDK
jgi:formylglycine-generating enzyme required for sulfatase activity